jgi:eukaryotic-like serine/threonine-protein kinase
MGASTLEVDFEQSPEHPVVNISRDDAVSFCNWLTQKERASQLIRDSYEYRLPTDLEWSEIAGLKQEKGATPGIRDIEGMKLFPWGKSWPPQFGAGNLSDITALNSLNVPLSNTIAGYNDGYKNTAPVGSFNPNNLGVFDLCGNVFEWVSDNYDSRSRLGVMRGGAWNTNLDHVLHVSYRHPVAGNVRDAAYGFRIVLAKIKNR